METNQIEIKTLILSLAAVVFIEMVTRAVIFRIVYYPLIFLGAARILEIIFILLIVMIWGKGVSSIGLARSRLAFGFQKGLIWSAGFALAAFFAFVVMFVAGMNPLQPVRTPVPTGLFEITLFLCVGGLVAPIAEELFFRGVLYGFFRRWGLAAALILSTLLFVLFHPIGDQIPVTQAIGGLVFAVAYELEGSLMVPITIHSLGNTAIFTLSLIF
jgi:membrane protease YdiL (CAAX protease family)